MGHRRVMGILIGREAPNKSLLTIRTYHTRVCVFEPPVLLYVCRVKESDCLGVFRGWVLLVFFLVSKVLSSDKLVGSGLLLLSITIFVYYTLWVVVLVRNGNNSYILHGGSAVKYVQLVLRSHDIMHTYTCIRYL